MIDDKWTSFKVTGDYDTDVRSLYDSVGHARRP